MLPNISCITFIYDIHVCFRSYCLAKEAEVLLTNFVHKVHTQLNIVYKIFMIIDLKFNFKYFCSIKYNRTSLYIHLCLDILLFSVDFTFVKCRCTFLQFISLACRYPLIEICTTPAENAAFTLIHLCTHVHIER